VILVGTRGIGNEIFALSKDPSQRDLTRGIIVLASDVLKTFNKLQDVGEV
jgi:hypothetical protein